MFCSFKQFSKAYILKLNNILSIEIFKINKACFKNDGSIKLKRASSLLLKTSFIDY